jgi:modulator of FtsH protease
MDQNRSGFTYPAESAFGRSRTQVSTAQLLGQVMFLVAVAIGFAVLGTSLGRELEIGTARICSFAGFGMLIAASFVPALRVGPLAMGWLFATALMIGLGLGPVINYFAQVEPDALTQAAGSTALVVLGTGALGFSLSKDLKAWMRPLSFIVFGLVIVSLIVMLAGGSSPLLSIAIGAVSALLIVVDFNYLRKHGTEDDAVLLATGIFVSIVNIFLALLNIFGGD